jgi:hypothetical protein
MSLWSQHFLVLLIVAFCVAIIAVEAVRTLRGRKGKLGSCCAKGCETQSPASNTQRVVFLPAEMLTASKRSARN